MCVVGGRDCSHDHRIHGGTEHRRRGCSWSGHADITRLCGGSRHKSDRNSCRNKQRFLEILEHVSTISLVFSGGIKCRAHSLIFSGGRSEFFKICDRSEEHTSELQSLMRSSYAVFCLKKKKKIYKKEYK